MGRGGVSLRTVVCRYGLASGVVSLVGGFLCASSGYYLEMGDCPLTLTFALKALLYACVFMVTIILLAYTSPRLFDRDRSHTSPATRASHPHSHSVLDMLDTADWKLLAGAFTVVMMLAWLPYLLALYPGIVWWDTSNQIWQYLVMAGGGGFEQITDHHPIFDTVIFGAAMQFGDAFLGGDRHGLFLLVVLQSCATACTFSLTCLFLRRFLHLRRGLCIGVLLFFMLCPIFPIWTASVAKDTFFSWVFVLWLLGFSVLVLGGGRFPRTSMLVLFIVVTLLVCLTKKTGMYIVLPALLLEVVLHRKTGVLHAIVPFAVAAVTMFLVMPAIIGAFGMTSGGKQEMLAVPLNQTGRVAAYHGDDATPGERAAINDLLGYDTLGERYDPLNADAVKGFNELGSDDEYLAWLGAYVAQGMRHPLTYADAFLALESGWFSFDVKAAFPFDSSHHKAEAEEVLSDGFFERTEAGSAAASVVSDVYDALAAVPVVNLLTTRVLWACVIPAVLLVAVACARDKRSAMMLFAPIALSFILLMASPISSPFNIEASRYLLPFVYSGPLVLFVALFLMSDRMKPGQRLQKTRRSASRCASCPPVDDSRDSDMVCYILTENENVRPERMEEDSETDACRKRWAVR